MRASFLRKDTVDVGLFGPIGRSAAEVRVFPSWDVFWLIPDRSASALRLS